MKSVHAFIVAVVLSLVIVAGVSAQSAESIWLTANTTAYKTGETVLVTLNASSATPIQGFTFQIRYDPACLKPVNAASPITGMNGLPLPQLTGLVDGSYASTTPQAINGILAEVRFTSLGGCQTNLTLESAALAIRNAEGFAAPVAGVTLGEKNIALNIDKEVAAPQAEQPVSGSLLQLDPPAPANHGISGWLVGLLAALFVTGAGIALFIRFRKGTLTTASNISVPRFATVHFKHGPYAGRSVPVNKLPFLIGRDPVNDICINDPHVIDQHARIFVANNDYYLMDLGGETFVNGQLIRKSSALLKPGDVVRLGKSALFVFGT